MKAIHLDDRSTKGLVDTRTEATVISFNDVQAFPHWKLKYDSTVTGVGGDKPSKATLHPVHWKDLDSNRVIIADTPPYSLGL